MKKKNTTTINKLNKKKNNEKRIEKTTFELIWITKQSDANLIEGKSKQNESNLKKKKALKQFQANLLNFI
jgi:hypothetical protein